MSFMNCEFSLSVFTTKVTIQSQTTKLIGKKVRHPCLRLLMFRIPYLPAKLRPHYAVFLRSGGENNIFLK